jgi:hypothetical protein
MARACGGRDVLRDSFSALEVSEIIEYRQHACADHLDGRYVATRMSGGKRSIWLRQLETSEYSGRAAFREPVRIGISRQQVTVLARRSGSEELPQAFIE